MPYPDLSTCRGSLRLDDDPWRSFCAYSSTVQILGTPRAPEVIEWTAGGIDEIAMVDSVLVDPVEFAFGEANVEPSPQFGIYMADQTTWLEPSRGSTREIAPFDIALIGVSSPLRTRSLVGTRHLALSVPRSALLAWIASADDLCGQSFGLDPQTKKTAQLILAAVRSTANGGRFNATGISLVGSLLSLLSVIDGGYFKPRLTASVVRKEQITRYIAQHFADPELNVTTIAEHLDVSPRYLQKVCGDGPSPGEQLRRHRLQVAAQRLRSQAWRQRSITEIGYSCGFGSSSHFSSDFRRVFGVSPRHYRNAQLK